MFKVIDMHCDTIPVIYDKLQQGEKVSLKDGDLKINLEKMKTGNYLCQCFSLYANLGTLREKNIEPYEHVTRLVECWKKEIGSYPDQIRQVFSYADILENEKAGRMSAIMTVEEGGVYEGKLENLSALYDQGVRMSNLTWNFVNELAYPNPSREEGKPWNPDLENGLTDLGFQFIEEMERLGIVIDTSHLNDAGIRDILQHVKGPVIASHSNARALAGHLRNLSDENVRGIAEHGGVIGVNFYPDFLMPCASDGRENLEASAEDIVRHMKYLYQTGGIDCIALGTDFDGFDGYVDIEHAGQMPKLADVMSREGFTDREIEKIFCGNTLRVFKEVWK